MELRLLAFAIGGWGGLTTAGYDGRHVLLAALLTLVAMGGVRRLAEECLRERRKQAADRVPPRGVRKC